MTNEYALALNVIGAKDLLRYNSQIYESKIKEFENLSKMFNFYNGDIRVLVDLDKLLLLSSDLDLIVESYKRFRENCLTSKIFLSGCLIETSEKIDIKITKIENIQRIDYNTSLFGILGILSKFKAIGVYVNINELAIKLNPEMFTKSFYVPKTDSSIIEEYIDISIKETKNITRIIFNQFKMFDIGGNSQIRYFYPLICNYIRSYDFDRIKDLNAIDDILIEAILTKKLFSKDNPFPKIDIYLLVILLSELFEKSGLEIWDLKKLNEIIKMNLVKGNLENIMYDKRFFSDSARANYMRIVNKMEFYLND